MKLEISITPPLKLEHVKTGPGGDGKVFVVLVEEAIRVRTSEPGDRAL